MHSSNINSSLKCRSRAEPETLLGKKRKKTKKGKLQKKKPFSSTLWALFHILSASCDLITQTMENSGNKSNNKNRTAATETAAAAKLTLWDKRIIPWAKICKTIHKHNLHEPTAPLSWAFVCVWVCVSVLSIVVKSSGKRPEPCPVPIQVGSPRGALSNFHCSIYSNSSSSTVTAAAQDVHKKNT